MEVKSQNRKPHMFVASSRESLNVAYAIQTCLDNDAEVVAWPQGVFSPSSYTLNALETEINKCDFAAFVFSPEDVTLIRGEEYKTTRDNIVFELGLFIRGLGVNRCFIVSPSGINEFHLPTDLSGITRLSYNPNRQDENLEAALGPACSKMRDAMKAQGFRLSPSSTSDSINYASESGRDQQHLTLWEDQILVIMRKEGIQDKGFITDEIKIRSLMKEQDSTEGEYKLALLLLQFRGYIEIVITNGLSTYKLTKKGFQWLTENIQKI
jgi:hypothetical protein